MQGRTAQVPTWFTGEASPTGNEDPYGMNNNERLLTGLSLGNTPGIAGNTEKSYKTPLGIHYDSLSMLFWAYVFFNAVNSGPSILELSTEICFHFHCDFWKIFPR
jgi:hypothetical protein